jgi:hypothetical protein
MMHRRQRELRHYLQAMSLLKVGTGAESAPGGRERGCLDRDKTELDRWDGDGLVEMKQNSTKPFKRREEVN